MITKQRFLTDIQVCILAGYFSVFWPIMPTNSFFSSWVTILYFLPLGFLIATFENNNIKHIKSKRDLHVES